MKKRNIMAVLLSSFLLGISGVNASSCSYSEQAQLNKDVANIKVKYEEMTGYYDEEMSGCSEADEELGLCVRSEYNYFKVSVYNVTEDFYFTVENNQDNSMKKYSYSDSEGGIVSFDWKGIMNVTTLTIKVYASAKTECVHESLRTIYKTLPRKNPYYYYLQCSQVPEYYLCEKYVTFDEIPFYEFLDTVEKEIEEKEAQQMAEQNVPWYAAVWNFIVENKVVVLIVVGVVAIGAVTTFIIVNKKRKKSVL
ncbi:MAG: hypothetical protein IJO63_04920 [Bacilli bacterium]|nr:hypothetical protein [Bacilli bacterium]